VTDDPEFGDYVIKLSDSDIAKNSKMPLLFKALSSKVQSLFIVNGMGSRVDLEEFNSINERVAARFLEM